MGLQALKKAFAPQHPAELPDSVCVARCSGESDNQIRAWLLEKLKALAAG